MTEVIRAEGLEAGFGPASVVRGLDLTVHDGDVVAVVGPNGSGKTTLLKALLGMMPLRAGTVRLFGHERFAGPEREALVAYIPQRMELDRTFPISLREMLRLSLHEPAIDKYVDMLELGGLLDKRVGDLSGGQMQRALLAYSVIKEPRLIVMDEPTSWVDARGADCILCIIEELKEKGIAMMVVSHDFSVIRAVSTHVLGLGPDGHFFESVTSPQIESRIMGLFGTTHHGGQQGHVCFVPHRHDAASDEQQGGGA